MSAAHVLPAFRLRPPQLPAAVIARPRVTAKILATEPGGTCLITAAPGYGATTAVLQAVAGSADAVKWVALDANVADEQARALVAAAAGAQSGVGVDAVLEHLDQTSSAWLVIDGLHPAVHEQLARDLADIAARIPAGIRLAITTHSRYTPISRAVHLSETDLELEPDEAYDVIHAMVPQADVEQTGLVLEAAEGWVSAVVAGAHRIRAHESRAWLRTTAPTELLSGWFEELPDSLRGFLEKTSVLELLGSGPAAAVTGSDNAADMLLELENLHCYVRPVDPPNGHAGRWWRRHGLLTAFLQQRAGSMVIASQSAAADWFIEAADVGGAMHHLITAGRIADAGEFLAAHESAMLSSGQADRMLHWYEKIATASDNRMISLLRAGWGQALSRDIRGADATLARLAAEIGEQRAVVDSRDDDDDGAGRPLAYWVAEESLLRAYLAAYHGDPATVVSAGRKAMANTSEDRSRDAAQLAPLLVARGLLWSGRPRAASAVVETVLDKPHPNDYIRELHLAGSVALIDHANGYVTRAGVVVESMLRWVERSGLDPVTIQQFLPLLATASVELERGNLDAAHAMAVDAAAQAEGAGHLSDAAWAGVTLARVHMARGDFGAALRAVAHARALVQAETPDSALSIPLDEVQALVHIAAGDLIRAERLIRRLPPGDARALLAARAGLVRQPVLSRRTLESIEPGTPRIEAERHLLLAAVHVRTSRRLAQAYLRRAAAIAHEHLLAQLLTPPLPGIAELAQETSREYQDDDLRWLLEAKVPLAGLRPPAPTQTSLSRGELHLLTILPSRAKNSEIAENLGISVNTVKTRLRRLYAKLGAANRDEAIRLARQRGLIEPD